MKNLIKSLSLAIILGISSVGCNRFIYEGKIDEDNVNFYYNDFNKTRTLEVIKVNGDLLEYEDYLRLDGVVDKLIIKRQGKKTSYNSYNPADYLILQQAQKEYEYYMKEIQEQKLKESQEKF